MLPQQISDDALDLSKHRFLQEISQLPSTTEIMLQSRTVTKRAKAQANVGSLIRRHRLHEEVYARLAQKLGVSPSYISRVASRDGKSNRILKALVAELRRIER